MYNFKLEMIRYYLEDAMRFKRFLNKRPNFILSDYPTNRTMEGTLRAASTCVEIIALEALGSAD